MFSASRASSGPSRASPRYPRSWPVVERHRSQWLACAHDNLDDEEFSSAWTWGEALTRSRPSATRWTKRSPLSQLPPRTARDVISAAAVNVLTSGDPEPDCGRHEWPTDHQWGQLA